MSPAEVKEQVLTRSTVERREMTTLLLQGREDRDPAWEVEILRRAHEARGRQGLVPQEEVEAFHRRLVAKRALHTCDQSWHQDRQRRRRRGQSLRPTP